MKVTKLSISIPAEMATWLRRASAKKNETISRMIREALTPAFESRRAKA